MIDIDGAFEFYGLDETYKEKCYNCLKEINGNQAFKDAFERVYDRIYFGNLDTLRFLWEIKDTDELFTKGINPFVTNLMIVSAYQLHKENMTDLKFDEEQIAAHKKRVKICFENDIRAYSTAKISDVLVRGAECIHLFDTPLLLYRNNGMTIEQRIIKRAMDIIISLLMLILTSPFLLISALAIKLYDGGPVFFRQERATLNGKVFRIHKFRSMIVDAEKDGKPRPTTEGDPRITPVGKILRATRLDELPQLIDILMGDMSLVGPRPERIEHVKQYTEEIPEFQYRLKVRGGLTGYAQLYGKYNTTPYDKLQLDLMYIQNYSLLLDVKLLLMTVKIMFIKESTDGFSEEKSKKINEKSKE
jgi:exopolysaccharide biosynthesis polyprenyl glycosylphosphotransferase